MERAMEETPRVRPDLVEELVGKRPDLQKVFDAFHELCENFVELAGPFSVPAPTRLIAEGAHGGLVYSSHLQFFHRVLVLRVAALLPEVVRTLNNGRLLSFAFAVRGVLETAGVAAYHAPRLVLPEGITVLPPDYGKRLRAAMMASRFDWLKFFTDHAGRQALIDEYDASKDWKEQWPTEAAANVLTMFEALADRLRPLVEKARGIVFHDYSLLSDLCHPAAGSYLLFLGEVEPDMRADLVPPHATVLALAELLTPCASYSAQTVLEVLADLEKMDARLRDARPAAAGKSPTEGRGSGENA